ncbi:MerR family DNA-binding transcriptional regulator [Idiomarina sp.]|uniref:MerR family DNA-binding transcriptional regulator n=1 Tax=Idiomarina sp. TaxID=1874361 RepID=UPI00342EBADB
MLAFSPLIYRDLFHASDVGTMKVNEIANLADVSPDTVRFYNREGLLRPRKDPRNGYNLYNSEDLWRVWTPPLLQAFCSIASRYDCLRVFGL